MLEQRCRGPTAMGPAQPWLFSGPSQESSQPDRGLRYQGKSAQPRGQTPGKVHRCAHCRKRFPGWVALWLHARRCQARLPLPCHECNQRFRHAPFLALHLQVHASAVPDLGFICHLCGHSFRGWVALVLHLRAHSASKRPITCPECDRRFWRQKQLRAHLRRCQPLSLRPGPSYAATVAGALPNGTNWLFTSGCTWLRPWRRQQPKPWVLAHEDVPQLPGLVETLWTAPSSVPAAASVSATSPI